MHVADAVTCLLSHSSSVLQVFHHSYPCVDRVQARDFLACCVGALVGFEKGPAAVFPPGTIRKSHFAAPQGDRYRTRGVESRGNGDG